MDGASGGNYLDNTIRAMHEKRPVPEIDFTLHTMEDGTQVSTQERVCKGKISLLHYLTNGQHVDGSE